jgi:hypothetical protein
MAWRRPFSIASLCIALAACGDSAAPERGSRNAGASGSAASAGAGGTVGGAGASGGSGAGGSGRAGAGSGGDAGETADNAGAGGGSSGGDSELTLCTLANECEEQLPVGAGAHVDTGLDYPDPPPVGGPHHSCWGQWGVHAQPLPDDNWVHNLEHGGVVILYRCPEGCDEERASLEDFVGSHPRTLLTEYAALPKRFAAVAWGYRLLMDTLDLEALDLFYVLHFAQAPESLDKPPDPERCP